MALSATEQKLLANIWQCIEGPPNVDYDKLARIMGHTNPRTTKNMMGIIRKKIAAADGDVVIGASSPPNTPAKATPGSKPSNMKRKATHDNEEEDQAQPGIESPLSKKSKASKSATPKKSRATREKAKKEESEDESSQEEASVKEEELKAEDDMLESDVA